jgi:hypothetical protein
MRLFVISVALLLLPVDPTAADVSMSFDDSITVDVGHQRICVYGHWLSGEVVLTRIDCRVYVNGYRIEPGLMSHGLDDSWDNCESIYTESAVRHFEYYVVRMSRQDLLIFLPGLKLGVSGAKLQDPDLWRAIDTIRNSQQPIEKTTWEFGHLIKWFEAEAMRVPMPIEKCKEF